MSNANTHTLTRAAELLDAGAAALLDCYTLGGDWGDEHEAREAHDEMMQVAADLRAMIAAAPQPPAMADFGTAPARAFRLTLVLDADTRAEIVSDLVNLASDIEHERLTSGVRGGPSSGAIYELLAEISRIAP